ncbi:Gfo/Idh/MocA family oxidoreductase [Dietzia kunjamensis]|nr:Gfo/Idh/MocA family oxidoreductase [Dietzia kunjamensis]
MGRHHARILANLDGVELTGVVDPEGDRHQAARGVDLFEDIEQLIERGLDYCVVAVPTASHEEAALRLARAGVPTLIEKPLAHNFEAAERIAAEFELRGVPGAVGHVERYNAALQQARRRIASDELGEIYQVSTRRQGPFPGRIADVGVTKDLATHDIDITSWVTQREYLSVSAQMVNKSGRPHEDLIAVVGQLESNAVSSHLVNWLSPFKERSIVITGEKGALVADTLTSDLTFYSNGSVVTTWDEVSRFRGVSEGDVTRFAFSKPEPLKVEHENFRNYVRGMPADIVNFRQGARTMMIAEACIEAATSRRVVDTPLPDTKSGPIR